MNSGVLVNKRFKRALSALTINKRPNLLASQKRGTTQLRTQTSLTTEHQSLATSGIFSLPTELFLYMIPFLTKAQIWCFALTCKTTYTLLADLHELPIFTDLEEKFNFLVLLEHDLPEFIACLHGPDCSSFGDPAWAKLRSWRNTGVVLSPSDPINSFCCSLSTSGGLRYHHPWTTTSEQTPARWHVSEEIRRLVLRGELFGPEYGFRLPILEVDYGGEDNVLKRKVVPKLTNYHNLMVGRQTTWTTSIFNTKPYWTPNPEHLRHDICNHVTESAAVSLFRNMVDRLYVKEDRRTSKRSPSSPYKDYPQGWIYHPKLLKCQVCATEVQCRARVKAHENHGGSKWIVYHVWYYAEVVFEVYHDLGRLYKPLTRVQRNVVNEGPGAPMTGNEALARLRQNLQICWHGNETTWISRLKQTSSKSVTSRRSEYSADGVYIKDGIPDNVCFFRLDESTNPVPNLPEEWLIQHDDLSNRRQTTPRTS